jgi:O-antigen ligase
MAVIFYLTSFLFSLGQVGRITLPNQWGNIYLYEIFLLFELVFLLTKFKLSPLKQAFTKYKIIFIFFAWMLLTSLLKVNFHNFNDNIVPFLYLIRLFFYPLFFLYLSHLKINKNIIKKTLYIFIIFTLISSFVQYFFYPDLRNLYYLGWDPHLNRMFGTFFDTSIAASVYGLIFIYLFKNRKYVFSIIPLACLVLTFSRSAYLVLGLTLLTNFLSKKYFKYVLSAIIIFATIFFIVPKQFGVGVDLNRNFSITSRINDYKNAVTIWQKNPVIGIGYNRIETLKSEMGILNKKENIPNNSGSSFSSSYLIILVTTGIIGLALLVISLWKIYLYNKNIIAYLFFVVFLSFADNIILHPFIISILGVFILLSDS